MVAGIVIEHRKTINPKDDVVDSTEVDISAFVITLVPRTLTKRLQSLYEKLVTLTND